MPLPEAWPPALPPLRDFVVSPGFGGALVFGFFNVGLVVLLWVWRLMKGKIKLPILSPRI